MRHDGGDAETGFGIDFGGGIAWSDPKSGLSAELRGRGLLTHDARGFRERGFSGSLAWDPTPSSQSGPKLTLTQTVGASASGGADALLARGTLAGLGASSGPEASDTADLLSRRLDIKFGYGLAEAPSCCSARWNDADRRDNLCRRDNLLSRLDSEGSAFDA